MRLETLLPRPLDPCGGSECATLMGALIAAIHLDRRRARALGWRGVRPSGSLLPAWTCRVAGSGLVFGLVFFGEDADGGALRGTFAAYAFPLPDDPLFEFFPLEALRLAVDPGYGDRIRTLSEHAETLSPFRIGTVSLRAAVDGSGLSLTLSAPARLRMAALDGVAAFSGGQRWLVEPGGWETDVPAFRLLLRPFAALSATAESLLGDPARVSLDGEAAPIPGFDAAGNIRHIPGGTGRELRLTAAFGSAGAQGRPLARLPLRHKPLEEESGLPVLHILTGFLGSGKTTFLRQWLDFLHGRERYTGVIQNEFGEIGLDAALLRGETQVEALDEGCVCCSLADSLRPGLLRLIGDMPAEQFILETTGLANPANVMEALSELRDIVQPGLVITVADALICAVRKGTLRASAGRRRHGRT
ncbi:MAG: CobW family GTP-binding protein [Bilophila wadsworthia]